MSAKAWTTTLGLFAWCQFLACTCSKPSSNTEDNAHRPAVTGWADNDQRLDRAVWANKAHAFVRVRDLRVSPPGEFCFGCASADPFRPESPATDSTRQHIRKLSECVVEHLASPPEDAYVAKVIVELAKGGPKVSVEGDAKVVSTLHPCTDAFEKAVASAETELGRLELDFVLTLDTWCDRPPLEPAAPADSRILLTDMKNHKHFAFLPGWFLHCYNSTAWRIHTGKDSVEVVGRDGKVAASARWTPEGFEVLDESGKRAITAAGRQGQYGLVRADGKPAGTLGHDADGDAKSESATLTLTEGSQVVATGYADSWKLDGDRIPYDVIQGPAQAEGLALLGYASLPWPQRVAVYSLLARGRRAESGTP